LKVDLLSVRHIRPVRLALIPALGLLAAGTAAGNLSTPRASASVTLADIVSSFDANGAFVIGGQPTFPIGLSNPPPLDSRTPSGADGLDTVVNAGVTIFRVGPLTQPWSSTTIDYAKAWDQAALQRGVHTWVSLGDTAGSAVPGARSDRVLSYVVTSLLSDPSAGGLGLWKGADEPNRGGPASTTLRFAYCRVTSRGPSSWCSGESSLDPNHLWVTIEAPLGTASQLGSYSKVTDTNGVDVYPVTMTAAHPDLHQVGTWTRTLASITPDHSVWTTLQICSSGSHDRSGDFVVPTRTQERYMIYDAIINGARGLSFFGGDNPACWDQSDKRTGWNWTYWNSTLEPLVDEISADSPIGPALANPGSTRTLSTNDPHTEAISRLVQTPSGTQVWVLAAHDGTRARTVTVTGLPGNTTWAGVYTENRGTPVANRTITDRFGPWQVHVYRFALSRR
jgi:hypothetical protein